MSVCLSVILWEAKKEIELLEQQTERGECKGGKTVRNSAGPKAVGVVCAFTNKTRMEAGKRNLQGGDWGGGWDGMGCCFAQNRRNVGGWYGQLTSEGIF